REVLYYRNPMDPSVTSPVPTKDSMGMEYVPVYADESAGGPSVGGATEGRASVELADEDLRLAGVRTELATLERLSRTIRTVGRVVVDERRLHRAQTKVGGWVEKLFVDYEGRFVRRGQPMITIYSPELVATQQEYLAARANATRFRASSIPEVRRGGDDLVLTARRRLQLFDVPESFIERLERTAQPSRTVELVAPASGYVVEKEVVEGMRVEPGMQLFTVADLSRVWVEADFYESEARFLEVGQAATLRLAYDPTATMAAKIDYVYPELNVEARTLRVRFDLANPGLELRLGMFVDVEQEVDLGEGTVVADSAVLDSGLRQIVFVETGPGSFEPRVVRVLWRGDGRAQLAEGGVAPGERVAVKANFLLDSESRLRGAMAALRGGSGTSAGSHAGHGRD
ncbi:MAG: efflux RND transporter periplasmic adaptor subunit, partial [Thermoanaerobaculia bacterium]|nr:efflux RND transporter periplasmic adaptor subunit [Thermoanaerobaculia bacterium]